jgi:hypothetical protein
MENCTLKLEYGRVPKVLLLGNGINRAFDFCSWDELLESIKTQKLTYDEKECVKSVPYPLQPVILTKDNVGNQMKEISGELSELQGSLEEEKLLQRFASLPVDTILTTNYTYELEKALNSDFKCKSGSKCKWRKLANEGKSKYVNEQLYTYFLPNEVTPPIWHIHGDAARPDTMILGHYYYGKLLSKMQQSIPKFIARYKFSLSKQIKMKICSWIEYFMLGDVYIVGLGMSLFELDLWWLVNCKKRHFSDRKVVLYKPDIKPEEQLLAEAYGVIVEKGGFEDDYKAYYDWVNIDLTKKLERSETKG